LLARRIGDQINTGVGAERRGLYAKKQQLVLVEQFTASTDLSLRRQTHRDLGV